MLATRRILLSTMISFGLCAPNVQALDFGGSVGLGLRHTDNSTKSANNEQDDVIATATVSGTLKEEQGPFRTNLTGSFQEKNYTENTFSDKGYFKLLGFAEWDVVRDQVVLQAQNNYRQNTIDPIGNNVPSNIQDTNVFSIGPLINMKLGDRHSLSLNPSFKDFYYEKTNNDSQQLSITADWLYLLYRTLNVGVGGSFSKTEFDDETANANFDVRSAYLIFSGQRSKLDYSLNIGRTKIERDNFSNQSGGTADLSLVWKASGRSSLRYHASSSLTDSSRLQLLPITIYGFYVGDILVNISDVLRNNSHHLAYNYAGDRWGSNFWVDVRELDYKINNAQDRDIEQLGAKFSYKLNDLMSTDLSVTYNETELTQTGRVDENQTYSVGFNYKLAKRLTSSAHLFFENEDSTLAGAEYDETAIALKLVYTFGK